MSGNPFANEDVMEDYMSALLTDVPIIEDVQLQSVEQLLKTAPIPRTEPFTQPAEELAETVPVIAKVLEIKVEKKLVTVKTPTKVVKPVIPTEKFQVLLFVFLRRPVYSDIIGLFLPPVGLVVLILLR